MCMFSGPVRSVSDTSIFASLAAEQSQNLVYQMKYESIGAVAMVLPIPTPKGSQDDAVSFLNMKKWPNWFTMLRRGFPQSVTNLAAPASRSLALDSAKPLKVHEVGSYVASFVPSIADFRRLDKRFQMPDGTWEKLPRYADFGFAVFQLKPGRRTVHPMAFRFPSSTPGRLFFPTVHIHDGKVERRAKFHHELYCQLGENMAPRNWEESRQPAGMFVPAAFRGDLIDAEAHVYRLKMSGLHPNLDQLV